MSKKVASSIVSLSLVIASSIASGLTVTEGVDFFESAVDSSVIYVGHLDSTGLSTISGSLNSRCQANPWGLDCNNSYGNGDSQDSFTFTLTSGIKIDSIRVSTSNFTGPTNFVARISLFEDAFFEDRWYDLISESTTSNILTGALSPLDNIQGIHIWGSISDAVGDYSFDYTVGIQTSAVPVPATAWLFASAMVGIVGLKRKK